MLARQVVQKRSMILRKFASAILKRHAVSFTGAHVGKAASYREMRCQWPATQRMEKTNINRQTWSRRRSQLLRKGKPKDAPEVLAAGCSNCL